MEASIKPWFFSHTPDIKKISEAAVLPQPTWQFRSGILE